MKFLISAFVFLQALQSFAGDITVRVENAKRVGLNAVGIGSEVTIESSDAKIAGPAIFLGKAQSPDGAPAYQLYLNLTDKKVYYIPAKRFDADWANSEATGMQKVLNPYEQAGGTCTGYAIYDFLHQSTLAGFKGNGKLAEELSTEKGRTTMLVDNVNRYYLTPQHQFSIPGILNKYGQRFGFACKALTTDNYAKARVRVLERLTSGHPVLASFGVGTQMYKTPFALSMYDETTNDTSKMDNRMWIPRKRGERDGGGHSIVFAGYFEVKSVVYLVTVDSDWNEPRIWNMDSFLNERTALDEVQFTTCQ